MGRVNICAVFASLLLTCAGGCANPWQQHYTPNQALHGAKFTPTKNVQVRSVEPERVAAWAADLKQRRLQSNVAPEDSPVHERIQETNRALDALRIKERAPAVRIIGLCEFGFDHAIPLDNPQLTDFAKKIGADYAVVACQYGGKVDQTVLYPITTHSNTNATAHVRGCCTAIEMSRSYPQ